MFVDDIIILSISPALQKIKLLRTAIHANVLSHLM